MMDIESKRLRTSNKLSLRAINFARSVRFESVCCCKLPFVCYKLEKQVRCCA